MSKYTVEPTGEEISFNENEVITSKTDLKGHIVYANDVFCRVSEMKTKEVIGQPHNIIRHPDMPRAIFKLLWDKISSGFEIFAYVKNMSKYGKYYWVFAHVTPSFDNMGKINGYHSNRRRPDKEKIDVISRIYKSLMDEEKKHSSAKEGLDKSYELLMNILEEQGKDYDEFIWSIGE